MPLPLLKTHRRNLATACLLIAACGAAENLEADSNEEAGGTATQAPSAEEQPNTEAEPTNFIVRVVDEAGDALEDAEVHLTQMHHVPKDRRTGSDGLARFYISRGATLSLSAATPGYVVHTIVDAPISSDPAEALEVRMQRKIQATAVISGFWPNTWVQENHPLFEPPPSDVYVSASTTKSNYHGNPDDWALSVPTGRPFRLVGREVPRDRDDGDPVWRMLQSEGIEEDAQLESSSWSDPLATQNLTLRGTPVPEDHFYAYLFEDEHYIWPIWVRVYHRSPTTGRAPIGDAMSAHMHHDGQIRLNVTYISSFPEEEIETEYSIAWPQFHDIREPLGSTVVLPGPPGWQPETYPEPPLIEDPQFVKWASDSLRWELPAGETSRLHIFAGGAESPTWEVWMPGGTTEFALPELPESFQEAIGPTLTGHLEFCEPASDGTCLRWARGHLFRWETGWGESTSTKAVDRTPQWMLDSRPHTTRQATPPQ